MVKYDVFKRELFAFAGDRGQQKDYGGDGVQIATGGNGKRRGTPVLCVRPGLGIVEPGQDASQIRADLPAFAGGRRVRVADETHDGL